MSTPDARPHDPHGAAHRLWPVLVAVAIGGALGGTLRYAVSLAWPTPPGHLPWATLAVNVAGCAAMGVVMATLIHRHRPHRLLRPLLATGLLGGFTTFSTYAVDVVGLATGSGPHAGAADLALAAASLVLTPVLCLLAVAAATHGTRRGLGGRR